jgi:hypothetical protein
MVYKYQVRLFMPLLPKMVWRSAKRRRKQYRLREAGQIQVSAIFRQSQAQSCLVSSRDW